MDKMFFFLGVAFTIGLFVWYGRHITFKSCRAYVFLSIYAQTEDSVQANLAASMLTWRACLEINDAMSSHALDIGGQPRMRQIATSLGWRG